MNKVTFSSYEFSDADLTLARGASAMMYWAPLGDELRADEVHIPIVYWPRAWQVAAEEFRGGFSYGDPLDLYENATLLRRFYLTDISGGQRSTDGSYAFTLHGVSFIGLFSAIPYRGNIFDRAQTGAIIAEILGATQTGTDTGLVIYETAGGIEYAVDSSLDAAPHSGYIAPTEDARNALRDVLQIAGATPSQDATGRPTFGYLDPGATTTISPYEIYAGDQYEQNEVVTAVRVLEYSWFKPSDQTEAVLLDASAEVLDHAEILFDSPQFDLTADGLTIEDSGATYAVVSGTGTLSGKAYVASTKELTAPTGRSGSDNVRTIDNTMCSSLYSSALLSRMASYFGAAEIDRASIAANALIVPGAALAYQDPSREDQTGYMIESGVTFSGITKHDGRITAGWDASLDAPFSESVLIDTDQTWTVPAGAIRLRFYLIGGGNGGQGGYAGGNGQDGFPGDPSAETPGDGGDVGLGGDGGKVLQVDVNYDQIEASYDITVGAAGAAGAIDGGAGGLGTPTTLETTGTTYTSDDGSTYPYGVIDALTGTTYAKPGHDGYYPGCKGRPATEFITDTATVQPGYNPTSWRWGANQYSKYGGGAAYGANGNQATPQRAGAGADAALDGFGGWIATPTVPGCGGVGGNGGGGGGAGKDGLGGYGGHGSVGSAGAPGAVLVLIAYGQPPTPPDDRYLFDADGEALYDYNYERLKEARP